MAEIGLRYRPSAEADLDAHAALLALLSRDLADMPPLWLERAATQWALESHFMPKASDLISIAQRMQAEDQRRDAPTQNDMYWRQQCSIRNDRMWADERNILAQDRVWVPSFGGGMRLAWKAEFKESAWECPDWLIRYNQMVADGKIARKSA